MNKKLIYCRIIVFVLFSFLVKSLAAQNWDINYELDAMKEKQYKLLNDLTVYDSTVNKNFIDGFAKCDAKNEYYVIGDIVADNQSGHLERRSFNYDENGNLLFEQFDKWDKSTGDYKGFKRSVMIYNDKNQLDTVYNENWKNGIWEVFFRIIYEYDNNGNMINEYGDNFKNNQWVHYYNNSYTFNNNNDVLTLKRQEFKDGEWINKYKYTHSYNEQNLKISLIDERWDIGLNNWFIQLDYKYFYNDNGNITDYSKKRMKVDGSIIQGDKQNWIYDNKYNMLSFSSEIYNNNEWINKDSVCYSYDDLNNLISTASLEWKNGNWVFLGRLTKSYDDENNLISDISEKFNSGNWVYSIKNSWVYDNKNRQIESSLDSWSEDKWIHYTRAERTYDDRDNVLTEESFGWDYQKSEWIPIERRNFTFDDNYNLTGDLKEGFAVGEIWKVLQDDKWTYDENNNASLVEAISINGTASIKIYFNNMQSQYDETIMLMGSSFKVYVRYLKIGESVNDVAPIALISPVSGIFLSETETVTIKIKNMGNSPVNNIPVECNVNGNILTGIITEELDVDQEIEYNFSETVDLSEIKVYDVVVSTKLKDDSNKSNDIMNFRIENVDNVDNVDISISVYPNPVFDYIYIEAVNLKSIEFIDMSGKIVKSCSAEFKKIFDVQDLYGLYLLKIFTDKNVVTRKILIK